jgi:hypothetical protein
MSTLGTLTTSDFNTVTVASQQLAAMIPGGFYRLVSTTNAWIKFGSNPTAAPSTDNNHYLPANVPVDILCEAGATIVAIIRDTADGGCTLTQARRGAR